MQALVPIASLESWTVTASASTDGGPTEDLTVAIDRGPEQGQCSIRTMRRTGIRIGPHSSVHGQVTDTVTTAAIAAGSLLLEAIPTNMREHEAIAAMAEPEARSLALAQDREGWNVAALCLDGNDYVLFTRDIPEGTVAHADLGWATIAMWSAGPLHAGPFRLAAVEPGEDASDLRRIRLRTGPSPMPVKM